MFTIMLNKAQIIGVFKFIMTWNITPICEGCVVLAVVWYKTMSHRDTLIHNVKLKVTFLVNDEFLRSKSCTRRQMTAFDNN